MIKTRTYPLTRRFEVNDPRLLNWLGPTNRCWGITLGCLFGLSLGEAVGQQPSNDSSAVGLLASNPVYQRLVDPAWESPFRLSPVRFTEGQSAEVQRAELVRLAAPRYRPEELLRPSVVAPHLFSMTREPLSGESSGFVQRARVVFALRGDLNALANEQFLDRLLGRSAVPSEPESESTAEAGEQAAAENGARSLTAEEIARAGIEDSKAAGSTACEFHLVRGELLSRVRIAGAVQSHWVRNGEGLLWAVRTDERFADQDELAATWERLERDAAGDLEVAERGHWSGGGAYLWVSRWRSDPEILICEAEIAWSEPRAWFGGANLIASKLPPAIQTQVRELRRAALRSTE